MSKKIYCTQCRYFLPAKELSRELPDDVLGECNAPLPPWVMPAVGNIRYDEDAQDCPLFAVSENRAK